MRRPAPGRPVLGALLVVLVAAAPAAALDVKVWPLFRYARDAGRGLVHWTALGPLVEYVRTPAETTFRVRPLVAWTVHRGGDGATVVDADVLFPLGHVRWTADDRSVRVLLLAWHAAERPATVRSFTLFPIAFWRRTPDGVAGGVLPFYLDLPDVLGWERVTTVLFPLWLRLREPRVERTFWLGPFVSTVGGPDGRGLRVWPFAGRTEIAGRSRSRFVLWPFHVRAERFVPGYGWERQRVDFPVYARAEGAGRTTTAWGVLGWTHTVDERTASEAVGAPWPLVFRERALGAETWRTWRAAPFYGRTDVDGFSSRFWLWPAYRWRRVEADDATFERRDVLLILARWQHEWRAGGADRRLLTVFPLLRAAVDGDRRHGQVPALADSLLHANRGVLSEWAPLYGLLRWDTAVPGVLDWNVGWGLLASERGRLVGPVHLDLGDGSDDGA